MSKRVWWVDGGIKDELGIETLGRDGWWNGIFLWVVEIRFTGTSLEEVEFGGFLAELMLGVVPGGLSCRSYGVAVV